MTTLALRSHAWRRYLPTRPLRLVLAALLVLCGALAGTVTMTSTAASDTLPVAHHAPTVRTVTKIHQAFRPVVKPVPAPAPAPTPTVVRLRSGDTLWGLAQRYGTTVAALQAANGLGTSTLIYAGAQLHIPAAGTAVPQPAPARVTTRHATLTGHTTTAKLVSASTPPPTGTVQQIAASIFGSQYGCAANIITRESGWNVAATNRSSGAYGLAQALPGGKMASAGPDWRSNPATQLRWMLAYVDSRYGGACGAWAFWQAHAWY
jgi:LysM repeat protein